MKTVYGSFRPGLTIGKCKPKTIQADLSIFMCIQAYFSTFRHIHA